MKNRLRILRAERNWSGPSAELPEAIETIRQRHETGKFNPSLPLAFKLGPSLHPTIEAIFTDEQ